MALEFPGWIVTVQPPASGAEPAHVLVYGPEATTYMALSVNGTHFGAPIFIRPGYRFFTRPHYLLPTEVVDDIGQRFLAPECYDWLENRGDLFPRSDVIGLISAGGTDSVFVKELDLTELSLFASPSPSSPVMTKLDLALEIIPSPDDYVLFPATFPLTLFARAIPCYRLSPTLLGPISTTLIGKILHYRLRDWRVTLAEANAQNAP